MPPEAARKLEAYADTILELTPELAIDLRRPIDDAVRRQLAALGLGTTFAVMTAENPHGEHDEDLPDGADDAQRAANRRRSSRLAAELAQQGRRMRWVETRSPDAEHRESCAAFAGELAEVRTLARRFGQLAFFFFDGERFLLCPGEVAAPVIPLPRVGTPHV